MSCIPGLIWRPWRAEVFFYSFFINIIIKYKKLFRVFIEITNIHELKPNHGWRPLQNHLQNSNTHLHGLQERKRSFTFFQPLINTNFFKIFFSRPNLKERMSFRDGIIFKISSPHTEKIYIGCSSLPLNRERKEENARSQRRRCRREKNAGILGNYCATETI